MRDLEAQRAVRVYAAHRKELIFNVARRLSRATEMDRVETMHNEEVLSQMPGRDCRVTRPLNPVLNIRVQLPAIDVPDHSRISLERLQQRVLRSRTDVKFRRAREERSENQLLLPNCIQLGQYPDKSCIGRHSPLAGTAVVVARLQPRASLAAERYVGSIPQNLVAGVSLQELQALAIGIHQAAGALQLAAWTARGHVRIVELHGHCQEQMGSVGMRAAKKLARTVLRRIKKLGAGLVDIGILRHSLDRSALPCQGMSRG